MRLLRFSLFLPLFFILSACTPDQRSTGRQAEQAYVDLLYAIYHEDATAAKAAAQELDQTLAELRTSWYRPYDEERLEDIQYHLDQAAWVYADVRASLTTGNFELAATQLDRATYELSAASPAAMEELYVGTIYDFLITWLEVKRAVGEPDLCSLEWQEFSHYAKDVRINWKQVRNARPHQRMYGPEAPIDETAFTAAHKKVDELVTGFQEILQNGDQCQAAEEAAKVDVAIWELVLLFSTRGRRGAI